MRLPGFRTVNHHPDLEVGYNKCRVEYMTHAISGFPKMISFVRQKIDALLKI
jgi:4a-hydroxytetrahydrobiopterin dehydratase